VKKKLKITEIQVRSFVTQLPTIATDEMKGGTGRACRKSRAFNKPDCILQNGTRYPVCQL